jgi:hypothetical protein
MTSFILVIVKPCDVFDADKFAEFAQDANGSTTSPQAGAPPGDVVLAQDGFDLLGRKQQLRVGWFGWQF